MMESILGILFLIALVVAFTAVCLSPEPEATCDTKPTPPREPAPMQIVESEGPFDNVIDLLNVISGYQEFDDWGIYVDGKLLRTAIPADSDKYLVYETIGRKIYRK